MSDRARRWMNGLPFVAAFVYFLALAPYGLNLDDEGSLLYQIYRASVGQVLYRDFHAGYTPGVYTLNAFLWNLFGVNVLYVRWVLAVVNAAAVQGIYLLALSAGAKPLPAALAAASYVALIPFYDGDFLAANIPYPIWYVVALWLAGLWMIERWWRTDRVRWWLALGVIGAAIFWFKPNSGVLACGGYLASLACLSALEPVSSRPSWSERLLSTLRKAVPWVLVVGVAWMIASAGDWREQIYLGLPVLCFTVLAVRAAPALARPVPAVRLWACGGAFALGFAFFTVPWVWSYLRLLGEQRFARAVLFVGTNFERFYYIPYPPLSRVGLLVAGALLAMTLVVVLVRARVVPRAVVLGGAVLGALGVAGFLWANPPPMVEGWSAAVTSRMRDLSFVLALFTLWAAIVRWGMSQRRLERAVAGGEAGPRRLRREQAARLSLLFGALTMHVQLYPRADFMHLVPAAPGILAIGGWLLSRTLDWAAAVLLRDRRWARRTALAALLPGVIVVLSMVGPACYRAGYVLAAAWLRNRSALVELAHPRAPLVIEPAAGRLFLSLRDTARFLAEHTAPGEFVFPFPVLDVLCFLSDRHNPTRHGYFYPGWPGHAVEAEVLDDLRTRPPRWIVLLHAHPLFFAESPVYFFNLRRFVTEQYAVEARIGMFELLRPASLPGPEYAASEPLPEDVLWKRELRRRFGRAPRELLTLLEQA